MKQCYNRFIVTIILILPFFLTAQWSSNPLQNTAIADTTGSQVVPKIFPTSDGGCYISWYDTRNGNYDIYMQRLNAQGEAQWEPNGMLISDHPQNSWVTDYDLATDANNNAVIVFNDFRNNGQWDIFAYKITPEGFFLWGENGIGLSTPENTDFEAAPKVTATSAGNFVVTWFRADVAEEAVFQKISGKGQKLWGTNGFTIQGGNNAGINLPNVVAADNDSVIAFWERRTGNFPAVSIDLYTQKFAPDGSAAWDSAGVLIYDLGNISSFAEPLIYPDGNGGAFYTYYDSPSFGALNVKVQHVRANGNLVFPLNGVEASINTSRLHSEPTLSYLPGTNELFVFWLEKNGNQNQFGIYGQKFSPEGNRLWTNEGRQFIGLGGNTISFVNSAAADTAIYVSYFQSSAPNAPDAAVKAFYVDRNGNTAWNDVTLSDASLGDKGRLRLMVNSQNQAFACWKDDRNGGSGDIFAQNINPDGMLGNPAVGIRDMDDALPQSFQLAQNFPNPFNPSTTIRYTLPETDVLALKVYNTAGQPVRALVSGLQTAGTHTVTWDGRNDQGRAVSSGLYFYQLVVSGESQVRKMLYLK